ncbi:VIT1/CCC1 transporter family protein [Candidatus Woesearchaeota archaeon]|nr:VIT1/CCC1 transporter family protein [Candidatus Woesearchaeota archaeon]
MKPEKIKDFLGHENLKNFRRKSLEKHKEERSKGLSRSDIRDFILGFQDGLVNTLGLVLGVASAVQSSSIVLISGLVTTFAESVSMAAVAYTSTKAAREFYYSQLEREKKEIKEIPHMEVQEIKDIYYKKGFRGKQLAAIVKKITSNKKLWLETMMAEELKLFPDDYENPVKSAFVVGISAVIGAVIPVLPFFFLDVRSGMVLALSLSIIILFVIGAAKAKVTIGNWKKSGIEMAVVGTLAALVGYLVGSLLGAVYA